MSFISQVISSRLNEHLIVTVQFQSIELSVYLLICLYYVLTVLPAVLTRVLVAAAVSIQYIKKHWQTQQQMANGKRLVVSYWTVHLLLKSLVFPSGAALSRLSNCSCSSTLAGCMKRLLSGNMSKKKKLKLCQHCVFQPLFTAPKWPINQWKCLKAVVAPLIKSLISSFHLDPLVIPSQVHLLYTGAPAVFKGLCGK